MTDSYKTKRISDIDDKSMKLYKTLEDMSNADFLRCLRKYNEHYGFVQWIRENARGLNFQKIF
jgi:hypothetical protein